MFSHVKMRQLKEKTLVFLDLCNIPSKAGSFSSMRDCCEVFLFPLPPSPALLVSGERGGDDDGHWDSPVSICAALSIRAACFVAFLCGLFVRAHFLSPIKMHRPRSLLSLDCTKFQLCCYDMVGQVRRARYTFCGSFFSEEGKKT
jgi:hypothetical protein